jgi:hypothetical protein
MGGVAPYKIADFNLAGLYIQTEAKQRRKLNIL